jgi:hypothetical protein
MNIATTTPKDSIIVELGALESQTISPNDDSSVQSSLRDKDDESSQSQHNTSSGSHSGSGNGGGSETHTSNTGNARTHQDGLFHKDGGVLSRARFCFILTLLVAAWSLAIVVYTSTTNSETDDVTFAVSTTTIPVFAIVFRCTIG